MAHPSPAPMSESFWKDERIAEYCKTIDRVTGPPAKRMIQQAGLLHVDQSPLVILDNACGAGVVTSLLYELLDERAKEQLQVVCGDFSEGMVQAAQKNIDALGLKGAKAQLVDAQKTDLASEFFTHVLTNFGIMLMQDPSAAVNECFRILRSGGVCGLTTWTTLGWLPDVQGAFATIPGAPPFPDTGPFLATMNHGPWYRVEYVEQQLAAHGFKDIKVQTVTNISTFENVASYTEQYSGLMLQFASQFWSDDERERYGGSVKPAMLKYLTEKYGEGKPYDLTMVAIVATARKP